MVPLILFDSIATYFTDKKYVIENIRIAPHITNVTNDDFADLFTNTGKFASKAKAKAAVTLKAENKEEGIKKDVVRDVLDKNDQYQLLDLRMAVRDTESDDPNPVKVSSSGKDAVDISLKHVIDGPLDSAPVADKVFGFMGKFPKLNVLPKHFASLKSRIKHLFGDK